MGCAEPQTTTTGCAAAQAWSSPSLPAPEPIRLRPYQLEAADAVLAAWQAGAQHVLVSLPTGMGKTEIYLEVLRRLWTGQQRFLIIAHRRELVHEPVQRLARRHPDMALQVGVIQGAHNDLDKPILSASIQTLTRRLDDLLRYGPIHAVVVDEAHHVHAGGYQRVLCRLLRANPQLRHLGITATPYRADGMRMVGPRAPYRSMAYFRDLPWAMRQGYLCPLTPLAVKVDYDTSDVRSVAGDFDMQALSRVIDASNWAEVVLDAWLAHAAGRPSIAFTVSVEHARRLADLFSRQGVAAAALSGDLPDQERKWRVLSYLRGEIKVLVNCNVLTEGFDAPATGCLLMARPTRSRGLYIQMVGRGTRRHPGKADCLVIDFANQDASVIGLSYALGRDPAAPEDMGEMGELSGAGSGSATEQDGTGYEPVTQAEARVRTYTDVAGLLGRSAQAFWTDPVTYEVSLSLGRNTTPGGRAANRVLYLAAPLGPGAIPDLEERIQRGERYGAQHPDDETARQQLAYLAARRQHSEQYCLVLVEIGLNQACVLEAGADYGWLVDMCERYAARLGCENIIVRAAEWRDQAPSHEQRQLIGRLSLPAALVEQLKRGKAYQLIAHHRARAVLERLGCR